MDREQSFDYDASSHTNCLLCGLIMNKQNYGSREACQRLCKAGIVLETEAHWIKYGKDWELKVRQGADAEYGIPAPSMAEAWRELWWYLYKYGTLEVTQVDETFACGYQKGLAKRKPLFTNTNPTDALIDLLIFTKGLDVPK